MLPAMIRANTRLHVDTIGDVYSLANCNEMGSARLSPDLTTRSVV